MERYICLQPEYASRFRCDGTRCQSRCCRDWGVTLDDASIENYRHIGNRAEREESLSHVRRELHEKRSGNAIFAALTGLELSRKFAV